MLRFNMKNSAFLLFLILYVCSLFSRNLKLFFPNVSCQNPTQSLIKIRCAPQLAISVVLHIFNFSIAIFLKTYLLFKYFPLFLFSNNFILKCTYHLIICEETCAFSLRNFNLVASPLSRDFITGLGNKKNNEGMFYSYF